jgi:hypothetical protein
VTGEALSETEHDAANSLGFFSLDAWEESPVFTARERAANALDRFCIRSSHEPGAGRGLPRGAHRVLGKRASGLTWLIVGINGWNRIAISFHRPPEGI